MNYQTIYDQIIDRARKESRQKGAGTYYEAHHILPKCMGGEGTVAAWKNHSNIVLLTPKEHYIAHVLLCKVYPTNNKVYYALWRMINPGNRPRTYKVSSRLYSEVQGQIAQQLRAQNIGRVKSAVTMQKLSKSKPKRTKQHIDSLKRVAKEKGFKGPQKDNNWYKAVSKQIYQYSRDGVLIKEWESIQQASTTLGINRSGIGSTCSGRYKSAGGFIWKYKI